MNTETKKLVKQAMELRRKGMSKMLRELYDEGETNVLYVAANVSGMTWVVGRSMARRVCAAQRWPT